MDQAQHNTIYGLNRKKEDLLGAVLLKWLKEGKIKIVKQQKKKLFKILLKAKVVSTLSKIFKKDIFLYRIISGFW